MGRDRPIPRSFSCRRVAVRRKAKSRALGIAGAAALGAAVTLDAIGARGALQAFVPFAGVAGNALLIAALFAAVGGPRRDARLEIDDNDLVLDRGGRRTVIPRSSIRGGWVVPEGEHAVAYVELTNGDVVRAELASPDDANALLEAAGVAAHQRALRVRMGPRWKAAAIGAGGALYAMFQIFPVFIEAPRLVSLGVAGAFMAAMAWLSAWLLGPFTVVIGTDGLEIRRGVRRKFVPYAHIRSVDTLGRDVLLELRDGQWVTITSSSDDRAHRDAVLERIRRAIENAPAVGASEVALSALDRNGSAFDVWLERLRAAAQRGGTYRNAQLSVDVIARVLSDARTAPERRIGAAVALRAIDANVAAEQIRVAAASSASEPVRVALERVLEDKLDEHCVDQAADAHAGGSAGTVKPEASRAAVPVART